MKESAKFQNWFRFEVVLKIVSAEATRPEEMDIPDTRGCRKLIFATAVDFIDMVPDSIVYPWPFGPRTPLVVEMGFDTSPHLIVKIKLYQARFFQQGVHRQFTETDDVKPQGIV